MADNQEILPAESIPKDGDDSLGKYTRALMVSDEEMKLRIAVVVALRAQGVSYAEITKTTGLKKAEIAHAMRHGYEARVALAQVAHRLDNVAVPLAADRLIEILDDEEHARHYDAIRDVLYGRGEFRNHSHSVNDNRNTNLNLTVEYEMPAGAPVPTVVQVTEATGLMMGTPRTDDDGADTPRY